MCPWLVGRHIQGPSVPTPTAHFCYVLYSKNLIYGLYKFVAICKPKFSDSIVLKSTIIKISPLKYPKTGRRGQIFSCQCFIPVSCGQSCSDSNRPSSSRTLRFQICSIPQRYRADKDYTEQIKIPLIAALSDRHQMGLLPLSEHRGQQHVERNTKDTNGMLSVCSKLSCCVCRGLRWGFCSKIPLQDQLGSRAARRRGN